MTDTYDYVGEGCITERFVTLTEPQIGDGVISAGDAKLTFDADVAVPAVGKELLGNDSVCYLIDFVLPRGTREFTISVE